MQVRYTTQTRQGIKSRSLCWSCQNAVPNKYRDHVQPRYLIPVKDAVMKGNRVDWCPEYIADGKEEV